MSTYIQSLNQIVFGSKDHKPFLDSKNQEMLFAYIAGILKKKSCHSYIVGGAINHVHIISHVHPSIAPAYLIKDIKAACHEMMERSDLFKNFHGWQVGYSNFIQPAPGLIDLLRPVPRALPWILEFDTSSI
jgi:putative transposase